MPKRFPILRRARLLRRVLALGLAALVPTVGVGFTCVVGMIPLLGGLWLESAFPSLAGSDIGFIATIFAGIFWVTSVMLVELERQIREARESYERPPGPRPNELEPSADSKAWLHRARDLTKSESYREAIRR